MCPQKQENWGTALNEPTDTRTVAVVEIPVSDEKVQDLLKGNQRPDILLEPILHQPMTALSCFLLTGCSV